MNLKEMEKILIDNNNHKYNEIMCDFYFNKEHYESQITYAYFNSCLDGILTKHEVDYSEEEMLTKPMTTKNYKDFMNHLVRKFYYDGVSLSKSGDIIMEICTLFNKMINLFDQGARISHDISLIELSMAIEKDPVLEDLFFNEHANPDMTPEEIRDLKDDIEARIKALDIPGISDLLKSGAGIKPDQLINMFFGLFMRVKASESLSEIYPKFVPERWVDGLRSRDSHFIETSIQRLAAILNSQTMKKAGVHNKVTSILAQDTEIVEEDCGSVNYVKYKVDDQKDLNSLEFKYRLEDGKLVETKTTDTHLIGTTVLVRSPLKCACKEGICATCFGANAHWNLTNDDYRFDVGFVAARKLNASESQRVLSVKHTSTPKLVDVKFTILDLETGEYVVDEKSYAPEFFDRKWNRLIFKEGDIISFEYEDIVKTTKRKKARRSSGNNRKNIIAFLDTEFGDWDTIRIEKLLLNRNGKEYILTCNSAFKCNGYERNSTNDWDYGDVIVPDLKTHEISYVIRNNEQVLNFNKLRDAYKLSTEDLWTFAKNEYSDEEIKDGMANELIVDQIEYMYNKYIKSVTKGNHVIVAECALRNKIKTANNEVPDWTKENPTYRIDPCMTAIGRKPSLSAILQKGHIYDRLINDTFHDVNKLSYSVFDLLFHHNNNDEIDEGEDYDFED